MANRVENPGVEARHGRLEEAELMRELDELRAQRQAVQAVLAAKERELADGLLPPALVAAGIRSGDYKIAARDIRRALGADDD